MNSDYIQKKKTIKRRQPFDSGEGQKICHKQRQTTYIDGGSDDTAEAKKKIMKQCGIHVVDSPARIGSKVFEILNK